MDAHGLAMLGLHGRHFSFDKSVVSPMLGMDAHDRFALSTGPTHIRCAVASLAGIRWRRTMG
jgi:hypothetical protein